MGKDNFSVKTGGACSFKFMRWNVLWSNCLKRAWDSS